jgi:hypothetical protein
MYIGPERQRQLPGRVGYVKNIRCAGHLTMALNPERLCEIIPNIVRVLSYFDFDSIAFRGLSGALVAPIVAMQMNKTLIAVRKPHEDAHTIHRVEGDMGARRFIILDDFVCSGDTVRAILKDIDDEFSDRGTTPPECLGAFSYAYSYPGQDPETALREVTSYLPDYRRKMLRSNSR